MIARIEIPEGFDPDADYSMYSQFNIVSDGFGNDAPNNPRRFRLYRVMLQLEKAPSRAEDVPAGKYHLNLVFTAAPISAIPRSPERFAIADAEFTIPNIPGGRKRPALRPGNSQTKAARDAEETLIWRTCG